VTIETLKHEQVLKRTPVKVDAGKSRPHEEQVTVVGDGWIDFRVREGLRSKQYPMWLELDRGTEPVRKFKQKIRALVAYYSSAYPRLFGTGLVSFAFVVESGAFPSLRACEKRVGEILRWTEEELTERHKTDHAELFLFTSLPASSELDPKTFFLGPVWNMPYQPTPLPFLPLPEGLAVFHEE
jgi:hypothetical protein